MSLFGMINWIYTWYSPRLDGTAEELAQQMSNIILSGVSSTAAKRRKNAAHGASRGVGSIPRVKPRRGERKFSNSASAVRGNAHVAH
jgi:hypothetical protein